MFVPATKTRRTQFAAILVSVLAVVAVVVVVGSPASAAAPRTHAVKFLANFTGPRGERVTGKWIYMTGGGWGNGSELEAYTDRAANASLSGRGYLRITARGETYRASNGITERYTSARLMSKVAVKYGTVSARIRMTGSNGAHPAFWLLGANYSKVGWPKCGEIDVMEAVNDFPNLYGSFHGPDTSSPVSWSYYNAGKMLHLTHGLGTGWHVYSATWAPNFVSFSLDGQLYAKVSRSSLPANDKWALNGPEQIILNIAVGGSMSPQVAPPRHFHATMDVDWVKVTALR